jgi:phage-related holin
VRWCPRVSIVIICIRVLTAGYFGISRNLSLFMLVALCQVLKNPLNFLRLQKQGVLVIMILYPQFCGYQM